MKRAQTYMFLVEGIGTTCPSGEGPKAKPRDKKNVSEEAILSPLLCTLATFIFALPPCVHLLPICIQYEVYSALAAWSKLSCKAAADTEKIDK